MEAEIDHFKRRDDGFFGSYSTKLRNCSSSGNAVQCSICTWIEFGLGQESISKADPFFMWSQWWMHSYEIPKIAIMIPNTYGHKSFCLDLVGNKCNFATLMYHFDNNLHQFTLFLISLVKENFCVKLIFLGMTYSDRKNERLLTNLCLWEIHPKATDRSSSGVRPHALMKKKLQTRLATTEK